MNMKLKASFLSSASVQCLLIVNIKALTNRLCYSMCYTSHDFLLLYDVLESRYFKKSLNGRFWAPGLIMIYLYMYL